MTDSIIKAVSLDTLLEEVSGCNLCASHLPHAPNPVLRIGAASKILIIGQAPGTRVHETGIPWNDHSGKRLRQWMGVDDEQFYDTQLVSIMPMGFCYPGKGKSGDLPPRPECAPQWHEKLLKFLPDVECTLLIGQYAQKRYLESSFTSLTECVSQWREFAPHVFVLPHPSPRNRIWLSRNEWFEREVVPELKAAIGKLL